MLHSRSAFCPYPSPACALTSPGSAYRRSRSLPSVEEGGPPGAGGMPNEARMARGGSLQAWQDTPGSDGRHRGLGKPNYR